MMRRIESDRLPAVPENPITTATVETKSPIIPKVVIIVSDGNVIPDFSGCLAHRTAVHISISSPEMPFPAIATTVATGVHSMTHGIVTLAEVDAVTLQPRAVCAADRLFPAFWTQGIPTALFGWPGSSGDPDVLLDQSLGSIRQRLLESETLRDGILCAMRDVGDVESLAPKTLLQLQLQLSSLAIVDSFLQSSEQVEVIGIALKCTDEPIPSAYSNLLQNHIESLLSNLPTECQVVFVQRATSDIAESTSKYVATYLLLDTIYATPQQAELQCIGGSIYALTGRACPHGATEANWDFLPPIHTHEQRVFPLSAQKDQRDWDNIIKELLARKECNPQGTRRIINLLVRRFVALSNLAYSYSRWDKLEEFSEYLVALRSATRDRWLKVLSLHRQGKMEESQSAGKVLHEHHPGIPVTILANCLANIDNDPELVTSMLQNLDVSDIKIVTALGIYGVLSIRVNLVEQGIVALERVIQLGVDSPGERATLSEQYYIQGNYEKARYAIGIVGHLRGKIAWRILRLRILFALNEQEFAEKLAHSILEQEPTNQDVQSIMQGN